MNVTEETEQVGKKLFRGDVETVEFKNVTFTYPNAEQPVLKNVSFSIKKGEKISIVGLNGAGKSTLVKLICRMYQADSGEFAPFACRYIYNAIIDHCRAMNYRLQRSVDAGSEEGEVLFDLLAHTTVDFEAEVTDDSAMAALRACKEKYQGVARKGVEAIELKLQGYESVEIADLYGTTVNNVNAWISRARNKLRNEPALMGILC